ncbi:transcription/translation regulatory transformer protein RfaH [Pseudomonas sp. PCH199]|uniref:transcription/translation regulatory transformer protein RfaH n=1 Tax=unclassified Pseudomonas TaxID=196821 RepID=UPI000BDB25F9|nr:MULTISPECIES: transcription/translation regulatory transformer protein RfaH [unclassified Pseudomonas]MCW8278254.1 transcription/translation regulatory transformer protein RfaH [Pseudomonas sp. PCH199]PAM81558.1 transcription/translation regulatory transformer protein RfaH [Pseudomonas sp. ERMR1:02]
MLTIDANASRWYLLQCKPRQDDRAQTNLLRQNYQIFRPQLRSERLFRGKPRTVLESLFPGYLFMQLSQDDNWAPIRSTRGVSRIVEFNHGPAVVADHVIEHLRLRCNASQERPTQALKPGESLQIISGPLSNLEGIFLSMQGAERVMLLLQLLNREQHVRIPLSHLEQTGTSRHELQRQQQ